MTTISSIADDAIAAFNRASADAREPYTITSAVVNVDGTGADVYLTGAFELSALTPRLAAWLDDQVPCTGEFYWQFEVDNTTVGATLHLAAARVPLAGPRLRVRWAAARRWLVVIGASAAVVAIALRFTGECAYIAAAV